MPAPLLAKDEVLARVFQVFRSYGYEGATLARLSSVTGLGRASLYHYFPGGKDQMAREVLLAAQGWLTQNVVGPLQSGGSLKVRLATMMRNVLAGYDGGSASCVINLMGIGEANDKFHGDVKGTIELWLQSLQTVIQEVGFEPARARRHALDALVRIEGALVVSRALNDASVFARALKDVEADLNALARS